MFSILLAEAILFNMQDQESELRLSGMKILLQCLLRQRAHFLNAWANAITSGLKNHLSLAAMFCGQSILVAGSGEHLITLAQ